MEPPRCTEQGCPVVYVSGPDRPCRMHADTEDAGSRYRDLMGAGPSPRKRPVTKRQPRDKARP